MNGFAESPYCVMDLGLTTLQLDGDSTKPFLELNY